MVVVNIFEGVAGTDSVIDAVRDFNLKADGSDETAKVQAIVDAAGGSGKSRIFWPEGQIKLTSTIQLPVMRGTTWEGVGYVGGAIKPSGSGFTQANVGGTNFIWDGVDGNYDPVGAPGTPGTVKMFNANEIRFATFRNITFHSTGYDGTGNAVDMLFDVNADTDVFGPGHINFTDCSFALADNSDCFHAGQTGFPRNCADFMFQTCEFWGTQAFSRAAWEAKTNKVIQSFHLQSLNYRFNQCAFAFVDTIAHCIQGGSVHIVNSDTFDVRVFHKPESPGTNTGTFSCQGMRCDRSSINGKLDSIPITFFDGTDLNEEPAIFYAQGCNTISNNPPFSTYPDPIILAKNQVYARMTDCDFRNAPVVRFYGSTKTALSPSVQLENCTIPNVAPENYIQGTGDTNTGWLIQIDQNDPGFGHFTMENCNRNQRPVDDYEAGYSSGDWRDPDDFVAWLEGAYTMTGGAVWKFDERPHPTDLSTPVFNKITGGGSFLMDSELLGHDGAVPYGTCANFDPALRTTRGAFDTGVDLTISATSYTIAMLVERNLREPVAEQQFLHVGQPDGTAHGTLNDYFVLPFFNSGSNFDTVLKEDGTAGGETNHIMESVEGPGFIPITMTWDQAANEIDFYLSGMHTDRAFPATPTYLSGMTGTSRVYVGGETGFTNSNLVIDGVDATKVDPDGYAVVPGDVGNSLTILSGTGFTPGVYTITAEDGTQWTLDREAGVTGSTGGVWHLGSVFREFVGRAGMVVIIPSKLGPEQIAELTGRMTQAGRAVYARSRTP